MRRLSRQRDTGWHNDTNEAANIALFIEFGMDLHWYEHPGSTEPKVPQSPHRVNKMSSTKDWDFTAEHPQEMSEDVRSVVTLLQE